MMEDALTETTIAKLEDKRCLQVARKDFAAQSEKQYATDDSETDKVKKRAFFKKLFSDDTLLVLSDFLTRNENAFNSDERCLLGLNRKIRQSVKQRMPPSDFMADQKFDPLNIEKPMNLNDIVNQKSTSIKVKKKKQANEQSRLGINNSVSYNMMEEASTETTLAKLKEEDNGTLQITQKDLASQHEKQHATEEPERNSNDVKKRIFFEELFPDDARLIHYLLLSDFLARKDKQIVTEGSETNFKEVKEQPFFGKLFPDDTLLVLSDFLTRNENAFNSDELCLLGVSRKIRQSVKKRMSLSDFIADQKLDPLNIEKPTNLNDTVNQKPTSIKVQKMKNNKQSHFGIPNSISYDMMEEDSKETTLAKLKELKRTLLVTRKDLTSILNKNGLRRRIRQNGRARKTDKNRVPKRSRLYQKTTIKITQKKKSNKKHSRYCDDNFKNFAFNTLLTFAFIVLCFCCGWWSHVWFPTLSLSRFALGIFGIGFAIAVISELKL